MGKPHTRAKSRAKKRISFTDWIDSIGVNALARELGIHYSTVCYWKSRGTKPREKVMQRIIELSGGKIGYAQIFGPETSRGKK